MRFGTVAVKGQFGTNGYESPLTTEVVSKLTHFSTDEIAKRLARELNQVFASRLSPNRQTLL